MTTSRPIPTFSHTDTAIVKPNEGTFFNHVLAVSKREF
jgi:hypothetical protein